MSDVVIRAEGLGKRYRIGRHEAPYKTLRESLTGMALAPARRLQSLARGEPWRRAPETIWALKDVDLEVRQGEVFGIIGRNGAGKSTLLKILARITEPTTGRVELRGRVGSLLEVGTGFHPELTGRENIYLNGAILGMRKAEIDRRFDEIVSFAEIDRFLDTPVKRYSSGMYVRLAFAVAAHMEPEILLVDEVLAVGDVLFQKKCLGKMDEVAKGGRTVLFVSHNIAAVKSLSRRAVLIHRGAVVADDCVDNVIRAYLSSTADAQVIDTSSFPRLQASHGNQVRIIHLQVSSCNGQPYRVGQPVSLMVGVQSRVSANAVRFGLTILSAYGAGVLSVFSADEVDLQPETVSTYRVSIPQVLLAPGLYRIAVSVGRGNAYSARIEFDVVRSGPFLTVSSLDAEGRPIIQWDQETFGSVFHKQCDVSLIDVVRLGRS